MNVADTLRGAIIRAIDEGRGGCTAELIGTVAADAGLSQTEVRVEVQRMRSEGLIESYHNPPHNRIGWRMPAPDGRAVDRGARIEELLEGIRASVEAIETALTERNYS